MPRPNRLIDAKGEVRELSAADMKRFRPSRQALPDTLLAKLKVRGPQKAPVKERITICLSPEVVKQFRKTGDGWQMRVDGALRDWLSSRKMVKA